MEIEELIGYKWWCFAGEPKNEYNGERIRELEGIINNQQEDFAQKMQDLEKVIKKQEETIVLMKGKMDECASSGINNPCLLYTSDAADE